MVKKLIEIKELIDLLGYVDERSIEAWCKKNKVPLFYVGKKTYTISNFLDLFISQKLEVFVKANYKDAESVLKAISADDETELVKLVNAPMNKESFKYKKKSNSKQADDFLTKLKAA